MGAFISYLDLAHGINSFFVLAPNPTIYNKLITDFAPGTPKYVFKGIAEFATDVPDIITGDNYESRARTLFDELIRCKVNIFNISKINSEVRGATSRDEFERLIRSHRRNDQVDADVGCIILDQPFFIPREHWVPVPTYSSPNLVVGKAYEVQEEWGRRTWALVEPWLPRLAVAELRRLYGQGYQPAHLNLWAIKPDF